MSLQTSGGHHGIPLEDAIHLVGSGNFQIRILLICGLAFMADAMEISLLSFLSECAGSEWDLSDSQIASITSAVFAGELVGAFFLGPLADKLGRKPCFTISVSVITLFGFLSAFSPNYGWLMFFRTMVGAGVGGLVVPFDLLAEFSPAELRGRYLLFIEYFWTVGSMFVVGLAWLILENNGDNGWRILTGLCSLPLLFSLLSSYWLPESPRWLYLEDRIPEVTKILKEAAAINGKEQAVIDQINVQHPHAMQGFEEDEIDEAGLEEAHSRLSENSVEEAIRTNSTFSINKKGGERKDQDLEEDEGNFMALLDPDVRKLTICLWVIWIGFGFSYYGIILFITRIFSDSSDDDDDGPSCSFSYSDIFFSAASEVVGLTLAVLTIDRGRTKTQAYFYLFCGFFVILLGIPGLSDDGTTAMAFLSRMCAMAASSATWVATSELYPTRIRATGHAVSNGLARIGGFMSPFVTESHSVSRMVVAIILGIACVAASAASFLLPETAGKELDGPEEEDRAVRRSRARSLAEDRADKGDDHLMSSPLLDSRG